MFVNQMVPELHALGLSVPDPDLHYDAETGSWISGEIDWEEFWRVIKGEGPCNKERLEARRQAHAEGRWVREALQAYAQKQAQEQIR
jgi:ring-1,2-phenylacetyl-CoA epoxidase subunit PaaA